MSRARLHDRLLLKRDKYKVQYDDTDKGQNDDKDKDKNKDQYDDKDNKKDKDNALWESNAS